MIRLKKMMYIIGIGTLVAGLLGLGVLEQDIKTLKNTPNLDNIDLRPQYDNWHYDLHDMHDQLKNISLFMMIGVASIGGALVLEGKGISIKLFSKGQQIEREEK